MRGMSESSKKSVFQLKRKRRSAAAALLRVRIFEDEAGLHQRFLVIERHAAQVEQALGVDEDVHAVETRRRDRWARGLVSNLNW